MSNESCCPPPKNQSNDCCSPVPSATTCCPPTTDSCCPAQVADDRPGYKLWPFVCGWHDTKNGRIPQVATSLQRNEIFEHWQMRWGLGRMRYSIAPGLYVVGHPDDTSPVLVTANYKMTFDVLRNELEGSDFWLLVLDTKGINVWCAAGKGTFGTSELVKRVKATGLAELVSHRTLILPQLGAVGVAAHEVKKDTGFHVVYGPIRANNLLDFIDNDLQATADMRRVTFTASERLVLTPVELVNARWQIFWGLLVLFLLGGFGPEFFSFSAAWSRGGAAVLTGLAGLVTGAVLVPLFLPWLPGQAFAFKGAIAGLVVGFCAVMTWSGSLTWLNSLALLIAMTAVSSWFAMHFTGSSTFTSPSGVEKEMRKAIPAQAAALLVAAVCWIAAVF